MPFIITDPCIETKDTACVDVCPVDCIHPRKDEAEFAQATMLYIHPEECIDCGACVPACPVEAIFALDEVPEKWIRRDWRGTYKGQKQIWYLLRLLGRDCDVHLRGNGKPEFDAWRWHDYWVPLDTVIEFKREVYRRALTELERFMDARPQTRRERLYGFPHPVMPPSYADPAAEVDAEVEHGWNHSLGEIVTALAREGLRIELLDEKRELGWPAPFLQDRGDGAFVWPEGTRGSLPLMYSLRARKD